MFYCLALGGDVYVHTARVFPAVAGTGIWH